MAEATADDAGSSGKMRKAPLIAGAVLGLAAAAAGYLAVSAGLLPGGGGPAEPQAAGYTPGPDVAFVALEPLLVSLGAGAPGANLRFEGHLEVDPAHADEVQALMPRVMDVLNGYLRAVEASDLRDPASLIRLRAQMLRRVQVVTGEGRVRDLLITKFLIS